jgi:hypothetical protein
MDSTTGHGHEVSEPYSCSLAPSRNQFPTILSLREISHGPDNPPLQYPMGLTTRFFSPAPELTRYMYGYGIGLGTGTGICMGMVLVQAICMDVPNLTLVMLGATLAH